VSVVQGAAGSVEGVVGDQCAVRAGGVDKLGMAGDVTGRPDPRVVGAQLGVYQHLTMVAGLDTNRGKIQIVGDRTAPGSDQAMLSAQLFGLPSA
jgi:hypothetical protein